PHHCRARPEPARVPAPDGTDGAMTAIEAGWPWLRSYPPGIDWHARFPEEPLYNLLGDAARRFADRPCLDFLGKPYTYAEVADLARRAAKGFAALGVGKGTRVGLVLDLKAHHALLQPLLSKTALRKIVLCPMAAILPGLKSLLYRLFKRGDMARAPADGAHLSFNDLVRNDGDFAPVPVEPKRDIA